MVNLTTRPLCPRKNPRYPLNSRLVGPQNRSGSLGKMSLAHDVIRSPACPIRRQNAVPSTIFRFNVNKRRANTNISGADFLVKWKPKLLGLQYFGKRSKLGKSSLKIPIHSDPSSGIQQYLTTECNVSMPCYSSLTGLVSTLAMNHVFLPFIRVIATNFLSLIANYLKKNEYLNNISTCRV